MTTSKQELNIVSNTDVSIALPAVLDADGGTAVDLSTGYTAVLSIREGNYDGDEVENLTNVAGLTLGADGVITVSLTPAQSLALRALLTKGVYTLNVSETAGPTVTRTHFGEAYLIDSTVQ